MSLKTIINENRECWEEDGFDMSQCEQQLADQWGIIECKSEVYCPGQIVYGFNKYCKQMIENNKQHYIV